MHYSVTLKIIPPYFPIVSDGGPPKTILTTPRLIYIVKVRSHFLDCIQKAAKPVNTVRTFMSKPGV
jgi:hypothetical protein